jgi:uncharacterized membrane protein
MRVKSLDLLLSVVIGALNLVLIASPGDLSEIRWILALPLVFILPGYSITEVLFYKHGLNGSERFLLTLGLSLAIDILAGLFLNMLPAGLQAESWISSLSLVTLVFSVIAFYLRSGERRVIIQAWYKSNFPLYSVLVIVLSLTLASFSVVYAVYGVSLQTYPGFTYLWVLPEVSEGKTCSIRVGIKTFEPAAETFRLTVALDGDLVATWSSLSLASQDLWVRSLTIPSDVSHDVSVDVRLYKSHSTDIAYREVRLRMPIVQTYTNADIRHCGSSLRYPSISDKE